MPRIRTFIAIDPGENIQARLVSLQENFAKVSGDVKWVERDNLHLTLLFLGEVDAREVPDVCRAVQEALALHAAFPMTVEHAGCFGPPRRPRTLWVGIGKGAEQVVAIHDAIETNLLELGCYRREDRPFTPHITLGRVRSDRPLDSLAAALTKHQTWSAGETIVREIRVMSSELTSDGPQYTLMSRAKLAD